MSVTSLSPTEQTRAWRETYEQKLLADWGWLTVTGLHWLEEGTHRIGSGADCEIRLASGSTEDGSAVPELIALLKVSGTTAELEVCAAGSLSRDGEIVQSGPVEFDERGRDRPLLVGRQSLTILLRRGQHIGVRTLDNDSAQRRDFSGCRWFDTDPAYRVEAEFQEFTEPKVLEAFNLVGDRSEITVHGHYVFTLDGQQQSLIATGSGERLFFVFRDATSGQETYGSSRFLTADRPVDNRTVLDFNQAYNPPCAFTPHATCPLPVRENVLKVPVRAGELVYQLPAS